MKTHDIAKILHTTAQFFEDQPNKEFVESSAPSKGNENEIAVSHKLLIKMYNMDKHQWKQLAEASGLEVDIKSSDSKRDALFKVMRAIATTTISEIAPSSTPKNAKSSGDAKSEQIAAALQFLLDRK